MKKIITLVFMSAVLALTSCNDFLDKYPKYGVDPESEVTNEIAVALTTACYKTLAIVEYVQPTYLEPRHHRRQQ